MFTVKRIDKYKDVYFQFADTKIYMGAYSPEDRKILAISLLETVNELVFNDFNCSLDYEKFLKDNA